jgi:hypothetical protein
MSRSPLFHIRLTVPVSQETAAALQALAATSEESVSSVVRRAIRELLRESGEEQRASR